MKKKRSRFALSPPLPTRPRAQSAMETEASMDMRISADYSIFENGAQKIDCYVSCVASGPVLLKPNDIHVILFNFWKQKFVEHDTVTLAIDRDGGSLLILEEKWPNDTTVPKSAPKSHLLWVHRFLNDDFWIF